MPLTPIRRKRLLLLIDRDFGNQQHAFAHAVERSPNYISRMLSGKKGIGEKIARDIESKLELPTGWLDISDAAEPATSRVKYSWPFQIDPVRFRRLRPHQKKAIEGLVENMIASFEVDHASRPRKSAG